LSFPFDLHSAAVFYLHMPRRAHAVPVPCHDNAVLDETSQGHGTVRHVNGMCELASAFHRWHVGDLPAFGSSDISGYQADFHEGDGTVGERQGRSIGMCELTWHGMAGERHGHGMA
jgi:hypothetical protein